MRPFFAEDVQLGADHQLGTPLAVYQLKPGLRLFHWCLFLLGQFAVILLVALVVVGIQRWYQVQADKVVEYLITIGCPLFCFVVPLIGLVLARREDQRRVIVCEGGLLQVRKLLWRQQIEVVRWQEIASIRRAWIGGAFAHAIAYGAGEPRRQLTLTSGYQRLDKLVAMIEQHSPALNVPHA